MNKIKIPATAKKKKSKKDIKTLIILDQCGEASLMYGILKGDYSHLHDHSINMYMDDIEHTPEEIEEYNKRTDECVDLVCTKEGNYKKYLSEDVSTLKKDWNEVAVIVWLP